MVDGAYLVARLREMAAGSPSEFEGAETCYGLMRRAADEIECLQKCLEAAFPSVLGAIEAGIAALRAERDALRAERDELLIAIDAAIADRSYFEAKEAEARRDRNEWRASAAGYGTDAERYKDERDEARALVKDLAGDWLRGAASCREGYCLPCDRLRKRIAPVIGGSK